MKIQRLCKIKIQHEVEFNVLAKRYQLVQLPAVYITKCWMRCSSVYLRDDHSHNALFGMKLNQFQHPISYTLEVMQLAVEPIVTIST